MWCISLSLSSHDSFLAGKEGEGEESELEKTKKQLKMLEVELESFKQATSAEDRSKAEIINAEKKARGQVCIRQLWDINNMTESQLIFI